MLLTKFADKVTILVRRDTFKASQVIPEKVLNHLKIEVRWQTEVQAFRGAEAKLTHVALWNLETGERSVLAADGAFVFIGLDPNTVFLRESGVVLDEWGGAYVGT